MINDDRRPGDPLPAQPDRSWLPTQHPMPVRPGESGPDYEARAITTHALERYYRATMTNLTNCLAIIDDPDKHPDSLVSQARRHVPDLEHRLVAISRCGVAVAHGALNAGQVPS